MRGDAVHDDDSPTALAAGICEAIREAGYNVSVFRLGPSLKGHFPPSIEMHAVRLGELDEIHVAKVSEPPDAYRCAIVLE